MDAMGNIQALVKALEAGGYDAAPSKLTQGAALQVEDLSPVMVNVTFEDKHIILQKMLSKKTCKSTLAQFDRQLSYGIFGGSAQLEGHIGQEETSDYVRITVPMAFYSHTRRVTLVSTMVDTVDGMKSDERAAADAAKKLAGDIEFDLFRGKADFTNSGVFDGHPAFIPTLPNMFSIDVQIRQSDGQRNSHDLMFAEYGSDDSVIISGGGTLTQDNIEDAHVRSLMAFGNAERLVVDPKVLSAYNKLSYGKERIILAGSAQDNTAADLRKQFVSNGVVNVEASRFLSGKTQSAPVRSSGPAAPASVTPTAQVVAGVTTAFVSGNAFYYYVTAGSEIGESGKTLASVLTFGAGDDGKGVRVRIAKPITGTWRFFNVYRSPAGGTMATAKFIGRVIDSGAATTDFWDLGNRIPAFVTGLLLDKESGSIKELAPYSRLKLAVTELSQPEAHFRFLTLCVEQPRRNAIIENLR